MLNFYLYSISSISLTLFYFATLIGIGGLLRYALGLASTPAEIASLQESIAGGLGFGLIAFPTWWLHWRWLRNQFKEAAGPSVDWHRFYLFTIVCLNALALLITGSIGLGGLLRLALGAGPEAADTLARAGLALTGWALSTGLWVHHWRQFRGGMGELQPATA